MSEFSEQDYHYMRRAMALAQIAAQENEVPVAALLVNDDGVIAEAHNQPIGLCDPTAHAEIQVLRQAGQKLQNYRLLDTTLYVTLEPCAMCAAAIIHARVKRLIFGANDPKTGACGSIMNIITRPDNNHSVEYSGGLLEQACGDLLRQFFRQRRMSDR
ncbi:MAG: tRNA adenosine(34) deaminase TadA [Pseudomonadota bacterium]